VHGAGPGEICLLLNARPSTATSGSLPLGEKALLRREHGREPELIDLEREATACAIRGQDKEGGGSMAA
jgi:hypothetical protein